MEIANLYCKNTSEVIKMLLEGQVRIPSGCAISGIMNKKGKKFSGRDIIDSIALMHDRSNGLGGGFAAYGIYPEYADCYAFHVFYDDLDARQETELYLNINFDIESLGKIPVEKHPGIGKGPITWRYFLRTKTFRVEQMEVDEDEFVVRTVFHINSLIKGSYVFSSGKNMGAFKAVGYPEDVGEYYMLDQYKAYLWTAHGRFPTNTPGWWGGAHPFTLLDWSCVHNGEISSYDANRRYIEQFGYKCTLMTDTEAITYLVDFLGRKNNLTLEQTAAVLAAPFWSEIDMMSEQDKALYTALRATYSSALVNGPFSILVGFTGGFMALNDRLKLRSLVAAEKGDMFYVASEESAIKIVCPEPERIWAPRGGEPVIVRVEV